MLIFYVRHGDPDYALDALTPHGQRQAEAVGKRLAVHGLDKIYTSPLGRARQTAQPVCEMLGMGAEVVDWASEANAWRATCIDNTEWSFYHGPTRELFASEELRLLGREFYKHPHFADTHFEECFPQIQADIDEWLLSLGYRHDLKRNGYIAERPNDERVALFAHQGFGMLFLSMVLDIPYPEICIRMDIQHSGMSVIRFANHEGLVIPTLLQLSNDSHIYREGLSLRYNNWFHI